MTTLVVAAHPDDEVLGCGGTIARAVGAGEEVVIVLMSGGITSRGFIDSESEESALGSLRRDSHLAAGILGANEVAFHDFPDNCFDTVPLLEIVKAVETLIDFYRPTVVYTHHGGDCNVDHNAVFRAVLAATRPLPGCPVREVYAFEVASSTEWSFQRLNPVFRPSVFVDITATLESKIEAMECYKSEARLFPHPRSPDALRAQATRWGATVGVAAAEAFEPIRLIR